VRIVLIGPSYPFRGGISHYTTLLYRHLKRRHEVRFLSLRRQYPRWLYPGSSDRDQSDFAIREEGTEYVLDPANPWTWLQTIDRACDYRPDLVILPWWVSFWAPSYMTILSIAKRCTQAHVLYLCHNVVPHEAGGLDRWLTRWALRYGDYFIVHSAQDQSNLQHLLPQARVCRTVHPTYDVFRRQEITQGEASRRLGTPGDMLLFFGFVRPYKGLEYLISAMRLILVAREVHLWVVGEFWQSVEMYRSQIESLGLEERVHIVNRYVPNEEVGLYFAAADAVVLPYLSGTGSGIAQIAFGYEKPVVATTVGDLPEVVEEGKTGFIVPPANAEALAKAVLAIYEKSGEEWAANIRARRDRFSWDRLADCIENFVAGTAA